MNIVNKTITIILIIKTEKPRKNVNFTENRSYLRVKTVLRKVQQNRNTALKTLKFRNTALKYGQNNSNTANPNVPLLWLCYPSLSFLCQ